MKLKLLLISLFILPVLLSAQQATSDNYKLVDYGLFNGNLAGNDVPASTNYKAEQNILGGLSDEEITSANYKNYTGYYLGPLTSEILPPENVMISVVDDIVNISWSAVEGATYKIYSSDDPNTIIENWIMEQENITRTNWSEPIPTDKKFYYVKAIN